MFVAEQCSVLLCLPDSKDADSQTPGGTCSGLVSFLNKKPKKPTSTFIIFYL